MLRYNKCFIGIVIISLALLLYGRRLTAYGYTAPENTDAAKPIVLAALSLREGVFPWRMEQQERMEEIHLAAETEKARQMYTEDGEIRYAQGAGAALLTSAPAEEQTVPPNAQATETAEEAEQGPPEFTTVDETYFADALFIGDSRIVGVSAYAAFPEATYYARTSMTIYNMLESRVQTSDEVETVLDGLKEHQFGKIYLMVGINEVGTGTTEYFISHYRDVVDIIQKRQPAALIYIQAIMHVDAEKDAAGGYINNANINERNDGLRALAEEIGAIWLDVNEVYDDADGNLPEDMTGDGVHLYAQCYGPWRDYLLTHAIPWDAELPKEEMEAAGEEAADAEDMRMEDTELHTDANVETEDAPGKEAP